MTSVQQIGDEVYEYVGTIVQLESDGPTLTWLTLEWRRDSGLVRATIAVLVSTSVVRDGVGLSRAELRTGISVTIWAEISPYTGRMDATDIILGTAPPNPASIRVE